MRMATLTNRKVQVEVCEIPPLKIDFNPHYQQGMLICAYIFYYFI